MYLALANVFSLSLLLQLQYSKDYETFMAMAEEYASEQDEHEVQQVC